MREAIVVGAGIGGLAAAKGLVDAGWRVTVLERGVAIPAWSVGVGLAANGMAAVEALDLGDEVRAVGVEALPVGVRTAQGTPLHGPAELEASTVVGVEHADLVATLRDAVRAADVVTGARVVRVEPGARPSVRVVIGDEESERTADLVVGADGIDSVVRRAIRSDLRPDLTGATRWQGIAEGVDGAPAGLARWLGAGVEAWALPVGGGRTAWAVTAREHAGGAADDERAEAARRVRGFAPIVRELVEAPQDGAVERLDARFLPTGLATYVGEGVVLVGDAAHAMPPALGQGAATTLEDAATLGVLAESDDLGEALAAYDALRRPRTQDLQRRAHRATRRGLRTRIPVLAAARNGLESLTPGLAVELATDWVLAWRPPSA